ncbi:RluA family pseudouridine synthase [Hydrogenophaga sp. PAMC20947]|uniref:RluA family pseudouridine synthase n=1 Tax=Hydrogenophaga sp. PAMC20947 TaxID=2565558 RepID=UPI00109E32E0|nr:RluA family pseudouridine synthase [Hydrogenophaga sp. PAMC20947]QCB46013.1 RluA family pseudouridine synthase [Hydrogenophaga sp. PAMC20947]
MVHHKGVNLVFEDAHLLVLDKPSGLLAVPGRGPDKQDCLSTRVQAIWPDALVVHRLDMATSGLVVMARGLEAQRHLGLAFEKRRVFKRYWAIIAGGLPNPLPNNGWNTIDLPLLLDWPNRPRSTVNHEAGKPSVTHWRLAHDAPPHTPAPHTGIATRVELEPLTGRSHQLRVHLQAIGHPILGDLLYADPSHASAADRLLLHAHALAFPHPVGDEPLRFESSCPF